MVVPGPSSSFQLPTNCYLFSLQLTFSQHVTSLVPVSLYHGSANYVTTIVTTTTSKLHLFTAIPQQSNVHKVKKRLYNFRHCEAEQSQHVSSGCVLVTASSADTSIRRRVSRIVATVIGLPRLPPHRHDTTTIHRHQRALSSFTVTVRVMERAWLDGAEQDKERRPSNNGRVSGGGEGLGVGFGSNATPLTLPSLSLFTRQPGIQQRIKSLSTGSETAK